MSTLSATGLAHCSVFGWNENSCMLLYAVTPCCSTPQEYQEGEAGFAIMFPSMEGVHMKPFHFCKKSISPAALKEAGECSLIFNTLIG